MNKTEAALRAAQRELMDVLVAINDDKVPFDGDDFHEALRLIKEALAESPAPAEPLTDESRYWIQIRSGVIDALAERGLQILSDKNRVWLAAAKKGTP